MGGGGGGLAVNPIGTKVVCFSHFLLQFRALGIICVSSQSFRVRIVLCLFFLDSRLCEEDSKKF